VLALPTFLTAFTSRSDRRRVGAGADRAAMVFLIIGREIDLSVASILALCSVLFGIMARRHAARRGDAADAFGRRAGRRLQRRPGDPPGLPSLVVTLGTMAMFRGIG